MTHNASNRRLRLAVAASVLCGAFLAACGSAAPSTSSSGATSPPGGSTSSAAATSSGSSALPTCPTGAAVSAVAGATYPDPTVQSSSGFLTCTYEDPTSGANLVIVGTTEAGVSASTIQQVVASQAAAQHATASSVSGLGSAAFSFTLNDAATNSKHVDTTVVEFIQGSNILDITAEASLSQVEAVGHLLIGQ